jgi:hypothetical protein
MNAETLFTRAAAWALPEESMDRALATLALRQLWHTVFDPCPELSKLYGDKNREFLDPFLEWAAQRKLSMSWTLHAHLLLWMQEREGMELSSGLAQELLAAAAARWAISDQSNAKGAILYFTGMKDEAMVSWKLRSVEEDSRVVLVRLTTPNLPAPGIFFAIFPDDRYPEALAWQPLPA